MITVIISKNGEVIREASGDFAFGAVVTEQGDNLHMHHFLNGECDVSDLAACCAENITKIIRVSTEGNLVAAYLLQMVIAQLEKNVRDILNEAVASGPMQ